MRTTTTLVLILASTAAAATLAGAQPLPPVPVPNQNPITEEKRVLGKILFWEQGLSSDSSVACGSCHQPGVGGADGRVGVHPGSDLAFGTEDDIFGSPGVVRADANGTPIPDPIFGNDVQVSMRTAPNFFGALWSPLQFWDGRATGEFRDPLTDAVVIPVGGALESQSLAPILNDIEMAYEARTWTDVTSKLETLSPLVQATDIPADMLDALATSPSYPELFAAAFGDPEITPTRIAFSIATYERTLVPDQTPWDEFIAGNQQALTPRQANGAQFVQGGPCGVCHGGPMFTNNTFRNIGLRPPAEDTGRQAITGVPADRGRFKVPSLRNVGLRDRLMHNGQITDVADAIRFYARIGHVHFPENQDPAVRGGIPIPANLAADVEDFLVNGLTDPRVANETFPFDRPTLGEPEPAGLGDDDAQDTAPVADMSTIAAQAFPNPFRDDVTIRFQLESASEVDIDVYSASGQLVTRSRVSAVAGTNSWNWDGRTAHGTPAPAGVYFTTLASGTARSTGRLVRID